jgi:calcineurin-like phosphoesterase family protein
VDGGLAESLNGAVRSGPEEVGDDPDVLRQRRQLLLLLLLLWLLGTVHIIPGNVRSKSRTYKEYYW